MRSFAVLHFLDGVVEAFLDDGFLLHLGMSDVVDECPTDATAAACVDESVLWTRVEGVFAIHELWVKHYVALLAASFQVGQTFPVDEVLGAGDASRCCGSTEVASRSGVVVTLCTEDAINPSVFVLRDSHVVDVRGRHYVVGHGDGIVPEAEIVDAVLTFCHGKEGLAVGSFHTNHQEVFPVQLDGTRIEYGIHADTFQKIRVRLLVEVVTPEDRCVSSGQDGMCVSCDDAVSSFHWHVLASDECLMLCE